MQLDLTTNAGVKVGRHYGVPADAISVLADSASEIVKFTISIPRESCTNAKVKYSSSVVPPDPSAHFTTELMYNTCPFIGINYMYMHSRGHTIAQIRKFPHYAFYPPFHGTFPSFSFRILSFVFHIPQFRILPTTLASS